MKLIEFDGAEISFFNNDEAQVTYSPDDDCKFLLQVEEFYGEFAIYNKIFIVHLNKENLEIQRWNALSSTVSSITWKL